MRVPASLPARTSARRAWQSRAASAASAGQGTQPPRKAMSGQLMPDPHRPVHRRPVRGRHASDTGEEPPGDAERAVVMPPKQFAPPMANSRAPALGDPPRRRASSSSSAAQPSSSPASVLAANPARQQFRAAACSRGSGGGGLASSRSSASRHQASRIAPSAGSVDDVDDVGQSVVDREQRIEGGPQLDRPVKPDEVAVRAVQR